MSILMYCELCRKYIGMLFLKLTRFDTYVPYENMDSINISIGTLCLVRLQYILNSYSIMIVVFIFCKFILIYFFKYSEVSVNQG